MFSLSDELDDQLFSSLLHFCFAGNSIKSILRKFKDDCLSERSRIRDGIFAAHSADGGTEMASKPSTCPYFLTYRFHKGTLEVYWVRTGFSGGSKKKSLFRRVRMNGGIAPIHLLLSEAHPDEAATIRRHEERARLLRQQWSEYADLRRRLSSFMDAHHVGG